MEEKKIDVGYFAIKSYEELNQNEKEQCYDLAHAIIACLDREYANDIDSVVEESKKMLYVCGMNPDEMLGVCIPYSNETLKDFDENYCYGYVPFKELNR